MAEDECKGCKYLEQKNTYKYPGTIVCTKGITWPISLILKCPIKEENRIKGIKYADNQ